jgi:hypothetical protein
MPEYAFNINSKSEKSNRPSIRTFYIAFSHLFGGLSQRGLSSAHSPCFSSSSSSQNSVESIVAGFIFLFAFGTFLVQNLLYVVTFGMG